MQFNKRLKGTFAHEIGHFLMGENNKFQPLRLRIKYESSDGHIIIDGNVHTEIFHYGIKNFDTAETYINKRIEMLCAGAIAEAIIIEGGGYTSFETEQENRIKEKTVHILQSNGLNDKQKINELIYILVNYQLTKELLKSKKPDSEQYRGMCEKIGNQILEKTFSKIIKDKNFIEKLNILLEYVMSTYQSKKMTGITGNTEIIYDRNELVGELKKN